MKEFHFRPWPFFGIVQFRWDNEGWWIEHKSGRKVFEYLTLTRVVYDKMSAICLTIIWLQVRYYWTRSIREFMKIFWAHVRCEFYLLTKGMWKGECKMVGYKSNNTTVICTITGSVLDGTAQLKKVFWPKDPNERTEQAV